MYKNLQNASLNLAKRSDFNIKNKSQDIIQNEHELVMQRRGASYQYVSLRPPQGQVSMQFKLQENNSAIQQESENIIQRKTNNQGLPDKLKTGIEQLSGYSMEDVNVHYNSNKPAQFQAHAFAQGTNIHLAPGQEKHLPHEAWHVVQQKQGRVNPTQQFKGRASINDDAGLEREADIMGAKSLQLSLDHSSYSNSYSNSDTNFYFNSGKSLLSSPSSFSDSTPIQCARNPFSRMDIKNRDSTHNYDDCEKILKSPYACWYLREHCKSELSVENIDFLVALQQAYPHRYGRPAYKALEPYLGGVGIGQIINIFIRPDSPSEINISHLRARIIDSFDSDGQGLMEALDLAWKEIFDLIANDTFSRFKLTDDYQKAMLAAYPSVFEQIKRGVRKKPELKEAYNEDTQSTFSL